MESQLFKNHILTLYNALENQVISDNKTSSGVEKAKCAEIASEIALDILRLEAESVKAIRDIEIGHNGNNVIKGQRYLENLRSKKVKSTTMTINLLLSTMKKIVIQIGNFSYINNC